MPRSCAGPSLRLPPAEISEASVGAGADSERARLAESGVVGSHWGPEEFEKGEKGAKGDAGPIDDSALTAPSPGALSLPRFAPGHAARRRRSKTL